MFLLSITVVAFTSHERQVLERVLPVAKHPVEFPDADFLG
jgi:hypothetical protein